MWVIFRFVALASLGIVSSQDREKPLLRHIAMPPLDPMTSPVKVIWPDGHTCIIGPWVPPALPSDDWIRPVPLGVTWSRLCAPLAPCSGRLGYGQLSSDAASPPPPSVGGGPVTLTGVAGGGGDRCLLLAARPPDVAARSSLPERHISPSDVNR